MLIAHGTSGSAKARQEPSPRGAKDGDVRILRAHAQCRWLAVYVLRRGYGQSDGLIPVAVTKQDGSSPTVQELSDADADDLEATLAYIGQCEDADTSRVMTLGISGGGLAVVALGARNTPGLKVISFGTFDLVAWCCVVLMRRSPFGYRCRKSCAVHRRCYLWYYTQTDQYGARANSCRDALSISRGWRRERFVPLIAVSNLTSDVPAGKNQKPN
jgi:pimeloyl-ACP methyl ester carboxylesterase